MYTSKIRTTSVVSRQMNATDIGALTLKRYKEIVTIALADIKTPQNNDTIVTSAQVKLHKQ